MNCCKAPVDMPPAQSKPSPICATCGLKAKRVERLTIESILKGEHKNDVADSQYYFCETPNCEVVYFSNDIHQYFTKQDVRVRVGIKETADPIPICYCFDHTLASAREEIGRTGRSTVVASIKAATKAGSCACEIKNPSGRCCLGEVSQIVKALLSERLESGIAESVTESGLADASITSVHDCCAVRE